MGAFGITDSEYSAWLNKGEARTVLAEVTAYHGAAPVTRYLASRPFCTRPVDLHPNTVYADTIISIPSFEARLSESFIGHSWPAYGELVIYNPNGEVDDWLNDGWDGREVILKLGSPSWYLADFRPILTGTIADIDAPSRDTISLKLRDKSHLFDIPIQTNLIGGSTANKDQPVPLCFGECFNVEPVLTVAASHTYQVHDGQIEAITAVRDGGDPVAYTPNLSTGTFTLSAAPIGRITADVKGAKPSGTYLTTCADIVQYLALNKAGLAGTDIEASSISSLNASCPQTLGLYVKGWYNLMAAIDSLVTSVGAFWTITRRGLLRLGRLESPAGSPALVLTADSIEEGSIQVAERYLPQGSVRLGYRKNWTQQDADALAGIVTEDNRALYSAPYSVAKATNSISAKHLLAPNPDVMETLIVSSSDASSEATRQAALRSVVRTSIRLTTLLVAAELHLGDVVHLTHPRFGFSAGALAVVISITERPLDGRIELELWK